MPGANYMGGKRNTVRAKLKDTTSRAQRGFFCRQRLAKGLIADKTDDNGIPETKIFPEITLFHAKHNSAVNQRQDRSEANQYYYLEQPHAAPTNDTDAQSSDRFLRDTSEKPLYAISLRSMCDRILAIPDLAGLHREPLGNKRNLIKEVHTEEANFTSPASLSLTSSTFSRRTPQSGTSGNGLDSMLATDSTFLNEAGFLLDDESPRTPISKYRVNRSSSPPHREPNTGSENWSPEIVTRLSSSLDNDIKEDKDSCTRNNCDPAHRNVKAIPRCDTDGSIRMRSLSFDTSAFTWSESPQAPPSAKALHRATSASDQPEPLPGCIFDYEDPWDAIGIIMGLPSAGLRSMGLEEELKMLGANKLSDFTTDDDIGADTLIARYSDSTSPTQLGSHGVKYTQETNVTRDRASDDFHGCGRQNPESLLSGEDGSMNEDLLIDYVTRGLDEDHFLMPFERTSSSAPSSPLHKKPQLFGLSKDDAIALLIRGPEFPVDNTETDEDSPRLTEAESDHRIHSITPIHSLGHPASYINSRPIDDNGVYYGPSLFSDDSDVESP